MSSSYTKLPVDVNVNGCVSPAIDQLKSPGIGPSFPAMDDIPTYSG